MCSLQAVRVEPKKSGQRSPRGTGGKDAGSARLTEAIKGVAIKVSNAVTRQACFFVATVNTPSTLCLVLIQISLDALFVRNKVGFLVEAKVKLDWR